jgi:hypothetical protein
MRIRCTSFAFAACLASMAALANPAGMPGFAPQADANGTIAADAGELRLKSGPSAAITFPTPDAMVDPAITPKIVILASVQSARPLAAATIHACHSDDRATCSASLANASALDLPATGPYQVAWTPTFNGLPMGRTATYLAWITARDIDGNSINSPGVPFQVLVPDRRPLSIAIPVNELGLVAPATAFILGSYVPAASDAPTLDHVDLLDGSTIVGTLRATNAAPSGYAFLWDDAPIGQHEIALRAVDSNGKSLASVPLPLFVVPPPTPIRVELTQPRSGMTFGLDEAIALQASASVTTGTIDRVEFLDGVVLIATATDPPFVATWRTPSIGVHAISARAYDDLGNASASPATFVETRSRPRRPQVVLTAPRQGTFSALGSAVVHAATVDAPDAEVAHVDFFADGNLIGTSASPPYAIDWTPPYTGMHQVTATVVDKNRYSTSSATVTYTVTNDGNPPSGGPAPGTPPSVTIASPADGAKFRPGDTIHLSAEATGGDGTLKVVDYIANGVVVASATGTGWRADWSNVAAGSYSLIARATTYQSRSAISRPVSIDVTPDTMPAVTVVMAKPPANATYYPGDALDLRPAEVHLAGSIARIDYLVDGAAVGTSSQAPYTVEWDAATPGSHSVVAIVHDTAGNVGTSAPVEIVVRPLVVKLVSPSDGTVASDGTVFVEGTFEGPSNTGILVNGVPAVVDPHGSFFINMLRIAPGASTVTAVASTIDGGKATTSVGVTGAADDALVAQRVYASTSEGIDSAAVDLTVDAPDDVAHWRILDAKGETLAQGDATRGGLATLHLPSPGLYRHAIEVTDRSNRVILKNVLTLVSSKTDVETSRMAVVARFFDALRREQRSRALGALTAGLAVQFAGVYDALKGHWSDIIGSLGTPGTFSTDLDLFSAAVVRDRGGQRYLYLVEGMRDSDGVWRIDSF